VRAKRRGFVLMFVLLLLALAAIVLAGIARRSLELALQAQRASQELQQQWGLRTMRQSLLHQAPTLLAQHRAAGEAGNTPDSLNQIEAEIWLGQQQWQLLLADEQTKFNVNPVLGQKPASEVNRILTRLAAGTPSFRLHPTGTPPQVSQPEQLFAPEADVSPQQRLRRGEQVTFVGNGRLHFRYSKSAVLREFVQALEGPQLAQELLAWREAHPEVPLQAAWNELDLSERRRERLAEALTEESRCFSLWLRSGPPQPQARWEVWEVRDEQDGRFSAWSW